MSFIASRLLHDTIQFAPTSRVLFLNSAADPCVATAAEQLSTGTITLAEDNVASLQLAIAAGQDAVHPYSLRSVAFHEYISREPAATIDVAILNLLYQPNKTWMLYALQVAAYALKTGGTLYVVGAKDRGILTIATRMHEYFGNSETLAISKGYRVICSHRNTQVNTAAAWLAPGTMPLLPLVFAEGQLDEGTRLLLDALQVSSTDEALDIGCGVGYLGLHIAQLASKGSVTMVDVSLAAVAVSQYRVAASGLTNIRVLPSDGAQVVSAQRFDLVVTNPPFHHGGLQTTETAERFIREAASVLRSPGRFYLVANRFLKYEPTLQTHFKVVEEVAGNTRFKVTLCRGPNSLRPVPLSTR